MSTTLLLFVIGALWVSSGFVLMAAAYTTPAEYHRKRIAKSKMETDGYVKYAVAFSIFFAIVVGLAGPLWLLKPEIRQSILKKIQGR